MKATHQSAKQIVSMLITLCVQKLAPATIDELIDIMTMFKESVREVEQECLRNYFIDKENKTTKTKPRNDSRDVL